MALVEIGPSHSPLVPKRDGWQTTVVDHATRAQLAAKYSDHGIDLSRIEDVDVVWSGGDLAAEFPADRLGSYDGVIASHVIEHMPDPVSFLTSAQRLLNDTGIVVLAVPDKRYCFDFFQPMTTTGDWLTAHGTKPIAHTRRVAFNHVAYSVSNDGQIAWGHRRLSDLRLVGGLREAAAHFAGNSDAGRGPYIDYHAWRFTPSSFQLVLLETAVLCDLDFHVAECSQSIGHEFFVVLRRARPDLPDDVIAQRRLALLQASIREQGRQADMLVAPAES